MSYKELIEKAIGEEINLNDWIVLTDKEADSACLEYIRDSVEYFNPSFLSMMTSLPEEVFKGIGEDNTAVLKIIEVTCGLDSFAEQATMADGRGHFLSFYDGEEVELGDDLFAYRVN